MQAAKDAVKNFTSKVGHKTEVDEKVQPSVVNETVKPHQHQEITAAIDREVHQHHHHTTVQPLQHEETLPEKHTHQVLPTQEREVKHEDPSQTKAAVDAELAKFKSGTKTVHTTQSASTAPTVTGEHVHHHVHENVIPVVHKSTIQPEVVHTTQPIHEKHHAPSQHHGISQLPMKSLDEFQARGGVLDGNEKGHSHAEYDGCPKPYNEKLSTTMDKIGLHSHSNSSATADSAARGTTGRVTGGATGALDQ